VPGYQFVLMKHGLVRCFLLHLNHSANMSYLFGILKWINLPS
jgi:hypothetical protein